MKTQVRTPAKTDLKRLNTGLTWEQILTVTWLLFTNFILTPKCALLFLLEFLKILGKWKACQLDTFERVKLKCLVCISFLIAIKLIISTFWFFPVKQDVANTPVCFIFYPNLVFNQIKENKTLYAYMYVALKTLLCALHLSVILESTLQVKTNKQLKYQIIIKCF